jgi:transcriptional regulator with XRE-family HTH domain
MPSLEQEDAMNEIEDKTRLKDFGHRVRELRLARGVTQEELALHCQLDRSYIGQVERGERNISLINIHKIAAGLGVPAHELLTAVGSEHSVARRE